jgi:L-fucose mutarotase/ribose pyranase (RbsD/FucU family)
MTGIPASALLAAIIPLFELDTYGDKPVVMMAVVPGDSADPDVEASFKAALSSGYTVRLSFLSHLFPHFLFYSSSPRYRGK